MLRGRMLAVLILALVLAAGVLGMLPPTAARAADGDGIQVLITKMTPVAKAGGSITVEGRVLNTGTRAIDSMEVAVRVRTSEPLFRSGISSPEDAQSNGTLLRDPKPVVLHNLAPGTDQPWTFTFPADPLGLGAAGAYPLGIEARIGGKTAGAARTFLPWIPKNGLKNVQKLRVAMVWPLVDRPHRDGTTLGDEAQTPVFRDDDLAAQFAPGGRLYDLVNIGTGMKVDWAIDPELLDSAAEMAGGYRVAPPGSLDPAPDKSKKSRNGKALSDEDTAKATPNETTNTHAGGGGQVATGWLDRLKTGIGTQPVIALPYADTDLAAVAHALGAGTADLRPQLSEALAESATVMQRTLGRPVRTDVAWPAGGALDPSIVQLANGAGASTVITSGASLPPTKELKVTPLATAALPGADKGTALVTDPDIDRILAADTKAPGQSVQATQQLLAELLTIVLQEPSVKPARSLLIAPPRTMDASLAGVLRDVLNASADWTSSATLADLAAEPAPLPARKLAGYPKAVSASEPSAQYLAETDDLVRSMQTFASILTRPERVTGPFNPALLRLLSTEWRGDPQGMDRYRLGVTRGLRELQSLVYIIRRTGVTLSGDEGNIPVTVVNNLQQPVNVRIAVDSHQPNRLKLGEPITVTVPDGRRREVPISAKSAANGKVMVDVRLLTPDGRSVRPPESFFVNTTTIDALTRWIIGGLAFLLAVFSLRAFLRKRREAALAGDANDEDGEHGDDTPSDAGSPEEAGPDAIRAASGWPPAHSAAPYAGGNGPPDPADPRGHTPWGSTTDRPE
ncbi:DUF6049 family protein [Embleya scabrispora]|uniref:DUF6049 family protein n=1 Tax=Embleya scabrispora TaxID=159449 RepID=UPI00131A11FE|nr:DUF6049 family protein [Embleya scabrispora]MYS79816.1 hypothetical protein [Streptomyces sp. SID5474]